MRILVSQICTCKTMSGVIQGSALAVMKKCFLISDGSGIAIIEFGPLIATISHGNRVSVRLSGDERLGVVPTPVVTLSASSGITLLTNQAKKDGEAFDCSPPTWSPTSKPAGGVTFFACDYEQRSPTLCVVWGPEGMFALRTPFSVCEETVGHGFFANIFVQESRAPPLIFSATFRSDGGSFFIRLGDATSSGHSSVRIDMPLCKSLSTFGELLAATLTPALLHISSVTIKTITTKEVIVRGKCQTLEVWTATCGSTTNIFDVSIWATGHQNSVAAGDIVTLGYVSGKIYNQHVQLQVSMWSEVTRITHINVALAVGNVSRVLPLALEQEEEEEEVPLTMPSTVTLNKSTENSPLKKARLEIEKKEDEANEEEGEDYLDIINKPSSDAVV